MMVNERAAACGLLRRLREQRGWSWADQARALRAIAERLGVDAVSSSQLSSLQRGIARWESTANRTVPGERYQFLLSHLYARSTAGELALGAGSDLDTLLTALTHFGLSAERTRELRDLVVRTTDTDGASFRGLPWVGFRPSRSGGPLERVKGGTAGGRSGERGHGMNVGTTDGGSVHRT